MCLLYVHLFGIINEYFKQNAWTKYCQSYNWSLMLIFVRRMKLRTEHVAWNV